MANQANYEVAGGSSPVIIDENLESSCTSSTCGDTTSSNSSEFVGARVLINEQSLSNNDSTTITTPGLSPGGNERITTDAAAGSNHIIPDQAQSCSAVVLHRNSSASGAAAATGVTVTTADATSTAASTGSAANNGNSISTGVTEVASGDSRIIREHSSSQDNSNTLPTPATSSPNEGLTPEPASRNVPANGSGSAGGTPTKSRRDYVRKSVKDSRGFLKSGLTDQRPNNVARSISRKFRVNVACQTDPDEVHFPKLASECSRTTTAAHAVVQNKGVSSTTIATAEASCASSSSSEGTLRLMIQNFKNMSDTVRGPSKKIQNVPWRIMVMPRQHVVQKKGTQKCLGFFLQCCPDAYSDSWSCQAAAELRLISQKQGVPNFSRKTNHTYTAKENDWGYSCFMTWADILDESQGYIKDDKVILEVLVKAEPPKNVLTHDQFEKKIQDYMRLAEMQSSRGLIDKAIEVNMSALKFCKDRDQECKAELEAQKAKLIEMKVKQSIERIEKGPATGKGDEENSLNQSALKMAISGTPANMKQANLNKSKSSSATRARDTSSHEKNGSVQTRPRTPPVLHKAAAENQQLQQQAESVKETRTGTQTEKTIVGAQGITTVDRGSHSINCNNFGLKDDHNTCAIGSEHEVLAQSPYRAQWIEEASGNGSNQNQRPFGKVLEEAVPLEEDRLTFVHDYANSNENRVVTDKRLFLSAKQNDLIRSSAMLQNLPTAKIREDKAKMCDVVKMTENAYEEELRRQSIKRIAKESVRAAQAQQKKEGSVNTSDMDQDIQALGKLTEDPEVVQNEQFQLGVLDARAKKIMQKQRQLENENKFPSIADGTPIGPVWKSKSYKSLMTGHAEPWDSLNDENLTADTRQNFDFSTEDEDEISSAGISSDEENDNNEPRTTITGPLSKKMKRTDEQEVSLGIHGDECDNCYEPNAQNLIHETSEAYCQTEYTMLNEGNKLLKVDSRVSDNAVNPPRQFAQAKKTGRRAGDIEKLPTEEVEWKNKMVGELKVKDTALQRRKDEERTQSEAAKRVEPPAELSRESIARFTSQFANTDAKMLQGLPVIYQSSQQLFGEELPTPQALEEGQPNVWSRQYIEEWLKFNIKYCWKYIKSGDENSQPGSGGEDLGVDFSGGNIPHFSDSQVQQVMAALSVIGVNCVNAKRVVDKAAEFISTLESRSKNPFLLECMSKLALLAGERETEEVSKESLKNESSLTASRDLCDGQQLLSPDEQQRHPASLSEDSDDLNTVLSSMDCPDDQHDYMLNREVARIGMFADQAVSKNPLMEFCQAERLADYAEKIANRMATLEYDKENLMKQLNIEKEKIKKLEQKHTNSQKQMQTQLQSEKERHEKTVQQLNQKKGELKRMEKTVKQHEKDVERARELQEKVDSHNREIQEMRQKHSEEVRKLQRELQSSQDTRRNMAEEIKGRDSDIQELRAQLSERTQALKRSENALSTERKSFQNNLAAANERAKKAEIMFLEHKLETGLTILERAHKDAGARMKELEDQKKMRGSHSEEIKSLLQEWKQKRDDIVALISSSKAEFLAQIEQIKCGKSLSQLPKLAVAKPPPAPKLANKVGHHFATQSTPMATLEKTSSSPTPSIGVIGQNTRNTASSAGVIGNPLPSGSAAPGSPVLPISKAPAPPPTLAPLKTTMPSAPAPIGSRPTSHTNGTTDFSNTSSASAAPSSQSLSQPTTSSGSSTTGITLPTAWCGTWDPPLMNDLLNPSRSFGPISGEYGLGSSSNSTTQLSQPPPGLSNSSSHFGLSQSNGWGSSSGSDWLSSVSGGLNNGSLSSNHHSQYGHSTQHQSQSGYQWSGGWSGYHSSQPGVSADINVLLDNNRSSSPRRDVLFDTLHANFPQLSIETLKEYVNDYFVRNSGSSTKSSSVQDVLHYVAQMVASKQQMWSKSSIPSMIHQPPPNVMVQSPIGLPGLDPYQASPSRLHNQQASVHTHVLMQPQMRDGLEN